LLSFRSGTKDKWYFLITFDSELGRNASQRARIPVNMSGTVSPLFHVPPAYITRSARFVSDEERLMERAKKILIPRIDLREATFEEALELLRHEAIECDPKHIGIPIEREQKPGSPAPDSDDARITVSLTDIPLDEALRYLVTLAGSRMVSTRTSLAILLGGDQPMVTHSIPLAAASKSEIAKMRAHPTQYFVAKGVEFSDGASCSFADHGMTLVIKNTPEQLQMVREALETSAHRRARRPRR
jgi:hypothetical protein